MTNFYTRLLGIAGLAIVSASVCNAQTATLALKAPTGTIAIDGSSTEWGDSLSYYNADKKIHYAISNDKTMLYLVVKTNNPVQEFNIMSGGITFSIDTKGKKKSSFTTSFPFPIANGSTGIKPGETLDQKKVRASVTRFKRIGVSGFKDISEDDLTTSNTYGIKAAINYDADGSIVYEEAIPLELFHAGDLAKGEWAFNIKLNGVEGAMIGDKPSGQMTSTAFGKEVTSTNGRATGLAGGKSSGGRKGSDPTANVSPVSSGSGGGGGGTTTPTIDFWGKFTLAQ